MTGARPVPRMDGLRCRTNSFGSEGRGGWSSTEISRQEEEERERGQTCASYFSVANENKQMPRAATLYGEGRNYVKWLPFPLTV